MSFNRHKYKRTTSRQSWTPEFRGGNKDSKHAQALTTGNPDLTVATTSDPTCPNDPATPVEPDELPPVDLIAIEPIATLGRGRSLSWSSIQVEERRRISYVGYLMSIKGDVITTKFTRRADLKKRADYKFSCTR